MTDWLQPLWEERAPRYTRALLETLALVAYRQPITRAEIEEVRGVVVSTNIVRTLLERNWIRVVGHRDVPGKPAMFGTTKEFLEYFGLKKLEDLPTLAEIKDGLPELSPQTDLLESLEADARGVDAVLSEGGTGGGASVTVMRSDRRRARRSDAWTTTRISPAPICSGTPTTMPRAPSAGSANDSTTATTPKSSRPTSSRCERPRTISSLARVRPPCRSESTRFSPMRA